MRPTKRAVAPLLAFLVGASSGCAAPANSPGPEDLSLTYVILDEKVRAKAGLVRWIWTGAEQEILDRSGNLRGADVVNVHMEFPQVFAGSYDYLLFVDGSNKHDLAQVTECRDPKVSSCQNVAVRWLDERNASAWFGSPLLVQSRLDADGHLHVSSGSGLSRLRVTSHADGQATLRPETANLTQREVTSACNLLTDETKVDLERALVLECRPLYLDGIVFILDSPEVSVRRLVELSRSETPTVRESKLGKLDTRVGILFPGSDYEPHPGAFTIREAHSYALNNSEGLAEFFAGQPDAAFEDVGIVGESNSTGPGGVAFRERTVYRLRYVASLGTGYEVHVSRERTFVNDVLVRTNISIEGQRAWEPKPEHNWTHMRAPPPRMSSIASVMRGVAGLSPSWNISHIAIVNTAPFEAGGPLYTYFLSFDQPCEPVSSGNCETGRRDYLSVNATANVFWEGFFSDERIGGLFG